MNIKTSELTGAALDWAVATEQGWYDLHDKNLSREWHSFHRPKYSTDWAHGGPIIEREKINLIFTDDQWEADTSADCFGFGGTALKAAMRCYVASKLGDEVDAPDDLIGD